MLILKEGHLRNIRCYHVFLSDYLILQETTLHCFDVDGLPVLHRDCRVILIIDKILVEQRRLFLLKHRWCRILSVAEIFFLIGQILKHNLLA